VRVFVYSAGNDHKTPEQCRMMLCWHWYCPKRCVCWCRTDDRLLHTVSP